MPKISLNNKCLLLEYVALFGILPPAVAVLKIHSLMYILLWVCGVLVVWWLKKNQYNFRKDWNQKIISKDVIKQVVNRFFILAFLLILFTLIMIPEHFLSLPKDKPIIWLMVVLFYPLLSVIPQEIIFRSFFFRRYEQLFNTPNKIILFSGLAFGWVHILLLNWVAVIFSAVGGIIFASTYNRTKSLALTCLEHALYGCFIFTIGLGFYFYHGQAVH